jgi:hypothetical protein
MALTQDDWLELLNACPRPTAAERQARTYRRLWSSGTQPRMFKCDDEQDYVVKRNHLGKAVITEQIAGRLGALMGAPVPVVTLVEVPAFLTSEPKVAPITAGIHHGSQVIPHTSQDREEITDKDMEINFSRFASLALFYGWFGAADHQVVYRQWPPREVSSVDHGEFLPDGHLWTIAGLSAVPPASPDGLIVRRCRLESEHLCAASDGLVAVSSRNIASAVAAVPENWGFPIEEQVAVAMYLARRREELLASLGCTQ